MSEPTPSELPFDCVLECCKSRYPSLREKLETLDYFRAKFSGQWKEGTGEGEKDAETGLPLFKIEIPVFGVTDSESFRCFHRHLHYYVHDEARPSEHQCEECGKFKDPLLKSGYRSSICRKILKFLGVPRTHPLYLHFAHEKIRFCSAIYYHLGHERYFAKVCPEPIKWHIWMPPMEEYYKETPLSDKTLGDMKKFIIFFAYRHLKHHYGSYELQLFWDTCITMSPFHHNNNMSYYKKVIEKIWEIVAPGPEVTALVNALRFRVAFGVPMVPFRNYNPNEYKMFDIGERMKVFMNASQNNAPPKSFWKPTLPFHTLGRDFETDIRKAAELGVYLTFDADAYLVESPSKRKIDETKEGKEEGAEEGEGKTKKKKRGKN